MDLAESIRRTRVGPLRTANGGEDLGYRSPAIHIYHGDLVDEQDIKGQQCSHLWVPGVREVQFRFQLAIQLQQSVYGRCLDVGAC